MRIKYIGIRIIGTFVARKLFLVYFRWQFRFTFMIIYGKWEVLASNFINLLDLLDIDMKWEDQRGYSF